MSIGTETEDPASAAAGGFKVKSKQPPVYPPRRMRGDVTHGHVQHTARRRHAGDAPQDQELLGDRQGRASMAALAEARASRRWNGSSRAKARTAQMEDLHPRRTGGRQDAHPVRAAPQLHPRQSDTPASRSARTSSMRRRISSENRAAPSGRGRRKPSVFRWAASGSRRSKSASPSRPVPSSVSQRTICRR